MAEAARSDGWFSRGDGGDAAAEEISRVATTLALPPLDTTRAGLPLRVPRAHLVPGSFGGGEVKSPTRDTPPPPERSPETVRNRLAAHQRGVRSARQAQGASR